MQSGPSIGPLSDVKSSFPVLFSPTKLNTWISSGSPVAFRSNSIFSQKGICQITTCFAQVVGVIVTIGNSSKV